jgi:hypothetical protein
MPWAKPSKSSTKRPARVQTDPLPSSSANELEPYEVKNTTVLGREAVASGPGEENRQVAIAENEALPAR